MNLYLVYGEESDGSHIGYYSEFNVVAAETEKEALSYDDDLLGTRENYEVKIIGTTDIKARGIIAQSRVCD